MYITRIIFWKITLNFQISLKYRLLRQYIGYLMRVKVGYYSSVAPSHILLLLVGSAIVWAYLSIQGRMQCSIVVIWSLVESCLVGNHIISSFFICMCWTGYNSTLNHHFHTNYLYTVYVIYLHIYKIFLLSTLE